MSSLTLPDSLSDVSSYGLNNRLKSKPEKSEGEDHSPDHSPAFLELVRQTSQEPKRKDDAFHEKIYGNILSNPKTNPFSVSPSKVDSTAPSVSSYGSSYKYDKGTTNSSSKYEAFEKADCRTQEDTFLNPQDNNTDTEISEDCYSQSSLLLTHLEISDLPTDTQVTNLSTETQAVLLPVHAQESLFSVQNLHIQETTQNESPLSVDPHLKTQIEGWIREGKVQIMSLAPEENSTLQKSHPSLETSFLDLHPQVSDLPIITDTTQARIISENIPLQEQNAAHSLSAEKSPFRQDMSDVDTQEDQTDSEGLIGIKDITFLSKGKAPPQQPSAPIIPFSTSAVSFKAEGGEGLKGNASEEMKINALQGKENGSSSIKSSSPFKKTLHLGMQGKIELIQHLKTQMKGMIQSGETHLLIKLTPDRLGSIDLKLDIDREGKVAAFFNTDSSETLDMLKKYELEFRQIFKDAGLNMDSGGMFFGSSQQSFGSFDDNAPPSKGYSGEEEDVIVNPSLTPELPLQQINMKV